ncbi:MULTISPECIES: hypothetical protein [unclassified Streptomyces]|uniref:hypothetical protein n=1 Tax=unclassified Streptomyces TaxID=2593676 RepID=UPI002E281C97|nr:hypothetical protein [Streptomyces sp. NBC_01423]WSX89269.1 hypothetical protein OH827_01360 [Streptomyces sp. NBC_00891]WSY03748.1 hypothetical protein OG464_01360 [Streptomyces sp. NBC_00890]WSZ05374.1 hypothetical protein OG704_01360 [Streptomyces sp. NBC_00869]WSZ27130.1 hypothetical protein OG498_32205 [Streptomyces sp. NBC_00870]
MPADLSPLIAATTQWLTRAFPAGGGPLTAALAEAQARQAVTVATWLRYPTDLDAALVLLTGPGGSARLDEVTGAPGPAAAGPQDLVWRGWVDEVVTSWAAHLLTAPDAAREAVKALDRSEHTVAGPAEFRRLTEPNAHDLAATALLRHPDLLEPIARLHHADLLDRLRLGPARAR